MKTKICICVILLILTVTLASCQKQEPEPYSEDDEYEPLKTNEHVTAELIFISRNAPYEPSNLAQIENMLSILNSEIAGEFNMDIAVDWADEDNYSADILARTASGAPPDAAEVYFPHDTFFSLAESGGLLDISGMLAENMPGTYEELRARFPDAMDLMEYEGKNYILPSLKANPVRYCIVTEKAIYGEYGKDITTLEDYEDYMQWISLHYPNLIPGYGNMYYIYDAYFAGAGYTMPMFTLYVDIEDRDLKAVPMEELEEFSEVYEMLTRWNANGYFGDISFPTFQTAANYGQLASFFINTKDTNFRKDISMMPTDREYEYIILYPDTKAVRQNPQSGMVFFKDGDAVERVMKFIERMYDDRNCYDIFHYGEEGENYNIKDGKIFLNMNQNVKAVMDWWGSTSLGNYIMDMPIWSEPENYVEFLDKISFDNTVSQKKIFEDAGIDYELIYQNAKGSESLVTLAADVEPLMEERRTAFTQFMRGISQNNFSRTTEEVIELLRDANGRQLADAFNGVIDYLKEN